MKATTAGIDAPGQSVILFLDADDEVAEINEDNNVVPSDAVIGPEKPKKIKK
jgi:subtilase family serine protease